MTARNARFSFGESRSRSSTARTGEVIAEAPSSLGGVLPLTDFGTAGFSAANADGQAIGTFTRPDHDGDVDRDGKGEHERALG